MIKYCKVKNCRYPISHTTSYHQCGKCNCRGHGMVECGDYGKIKSLEQFHDNLLPESNQCSFGECVNFQTHETEAHTCDTCYERLHSSATCPKNTNTRECMITCPNCRKVNKSTFRTFGSENKCVVCFDQAQVFLPECGHECLCLKCSKTLDKNNNSVEFFNEKYLIDRHYDVPLIKSYFKDYPSCVSIYEGMGCCTFVRRLNETSEIEGIFIHSDDGYDPNNLIIHKKFFDGYCKIDSPIYHNP